MFDIRRGVAIVFLVKRGQKAGPGKCALYHAELWGKRQAKYRWLRSHGFANTPWKRLGPNPELYLFVPRTGTGLDVYESFVKLTDIFQVYSVGIVTARDNLTIRWTSYDVWTTVLNFSKMDPELARHAYELGSKVTTKRIKQAQEDLSKTGPSRDRIVPILYRPFDVRYSYYTGKPNGFHERPRPEVMRHMLSGKNVALITPRRVEHVGSWQHAFVTNVITEHVAVSLKTIDYHFPLYIYPSAGQQDDCLECVRGGCGLMLFEPPSAYGVRKHNLNPTLVNTLAIAYGVEPSPEDILNYIYAVLYTPLYREKYADSLRRDFPRIPFPRAKGVFGKMAKLGRKLVELHLLVAPAFGRPAAKFHGHGDNKGAKGRQGLRYDPATKRVYINPAQYFAPVPTEVWEYRTGGYQVCEKWLKDRTERTLSLDEIRTYLKVVTVLTRTLGIQEELDTVYPAVEADLLEVK